MVIAMVIVCSLLFLICRGGSQAFGEGFGVVLASATFGLILFAALFALSAIIVPLLMGVAIPCLFFFGCIKIFQWVFFPKKTCP